MTYELKFRHHVLAPRAGEGLSFAQTAARFNLSIQTVFSWSRRLVPQLTGNKPASKIDMLQLREDIEKYPDAYQYERAERLGVSPRCIGYALKRLGVTYKKTLIHPKACDEKRRIYQEKIQAHKAAGRSIVFSDESGFAEHMPRTHGYALKGKRCYGSCDWGAKGRTNVIGALLGQTLLTITLLKGNCEYGSFCGLDKARLTAKASS